MRRSKPLALLAVASLLTLAACGGDDGDGGGGGASETRDEYTQADEVVKNPDRADGPAYEIDGATEGGDVTVYVTSDPGPNDLDPTNGWSVTGNSIQQALTHRSLTQYARNPETGGMELIPDLATDLGTPNDDFTEWTFTLRDGIKWEDGSDITAEEVKFGIERSMDAENFPSGPGTEYSKQFFEGGEDFTAADMESYDGVTVDGKSITIKMAKPFPDMDWWGAFMAMGPIPLDAKSPAFGRKPLSNGPYKVESFTPTEELVLVRNDQWDPATDPGRHQYPDKYTFEFDADPTQTDETMLSDNAQSQTSIATAIQAVNYQEGVETLGDRLVKQSSQCTSFLYPRFDKTGGATEEGRNVRLAIAYAYDYEAAWQAGGEIPGVTRVPANSVMPPGMAGKHDYDAGGEPFEYNPEKAKELLAEAGYDESNKFPLTLVYYEKDPLAVATNEQVVRGYTEAGFDVKAIPVQVSPYDIYGDKDNKTNQELTLANVNWCSDWPSGLTMLPPLLRTGGYYNTGYYSNPETDQAMDDIPTMPAEDQADAWGQLDEDIAMNEFPLIPTAFRNDLFVYGTKIGNFFGDGSLGAPNYKDIYVMQ